MLKLCEPDADACDTYEAHELGTAKYNSFPQSTTSCLLIDGADALKINNSRSPTAYRRREEVQVARSLTDPPTCSLHHEFSLLNTNIPHVEVESLDAIKRYAIFKISAGGHIAVLQVTFPTEYPSPNVPPDFSFCQGTTVDDHLSMCLLKLLKQNALQRVKKSRACLEQCLRALVTALKKSIGGADKTALRLQSPRLEGALSGALHDACIPFPRTSGVKFNGIGLLTTFGQVLNSKRLSLRQSNTQTPRTLSAINGGGLLGNVMGPQPVLYTHRDSNASFYMQDRMHVKHAKSRNIPKPNTCTPVVHIYDASRVLNLSREIAQAYSLDHQQLIASCRHNRQVCEMQGFYEVAPIWTFAEMIATPNVPEENINDWHSNKDRFKKLLLDAIIMHCAGKGDLQSAVTLACLFHSCNGISSASLSHVEHKLVQQLTPTSSPYHTVLPIDYHARDLNSRHQSSYAIMQQMKQNRSNSWSDSLDLVEGKFCAHSENCSLIRRSKSNLFDQFKRAYAELLFGWQLLIKCALIIKHTSHNKPLTQGVELVAECHSCKKPKRTPACANCQKPVMYCIICCLPVKGVANACLCCGHGGHLKHMKTWFEKHQVCATGCGCRCLEQAALMLEHIG